MLQPQYAIRKVQETQEGLELNALDQVLVYGNEDNFLGGNINTIKNKTDYTGQKRNWSRSRYR
jgi:hypothetical protein